MNWRSEKYLRLVAKLPCMQCGNVGNTQAAHSNSQRFGRGRSIKAHDWATFPLCSVSGNRCHEQHDNYMAMLSKVERIDLEWLWITKTLAALWNAAFGGPVSFEGLEIEDAQGFAQQIADGYTMKEVKAA